MRTFIILITSLLCSFTANAQKIVEKKFIAGEKKTVEMKLRIADSIIIRTWDKSEIWFRASVNINDNSENVIYLTSFNESKDKITAEAEIGETNLRRFGNNIFESQILWEIFIPENTRFSLETINGCITVRGVTDGMDVKTLSGFIDLSLSPAKAADIHFSTVSGSVYSDYNLKQSGNSNGIPSVIRESLNNGGPLIRLESISGDIFFRKTV